MRRDWLDTSDPSSTLLLSTPIFHTSESVKQDREVRNGDVDGNSSMKSPVKGICHCWHYAPALVSVGGSMRLPMLDTSKQTNQQTRNCCHPDQHCAISAEQLAAAQAAARALRVSCPMAAVKGTACCSLLLLQVATHADAATAHLCTDAACSLQRVHSRTHAKHMRGG